MAEGPRPSPGCPLRAVLSLPGQGQLPEPPVTGEEPSPPSGGRGRPPKSEGLRRQLLLSPASLMTRHRSVCCPLGSTSPEAAEYTRPPGLGSPRRDHISQLRRCPPWAGRTGRGRTPIVSCPYMLSTSGFSKHFTVMSLLKQDTMWWWDRHCDPYMRRWTEDSSSGSQGPSPAKLGSEASGRT